MIIDTHTHLYLEDFDEDNKGRSAVSRAIEAGVSKMIFPNVDLSTIKPMRSLASHYPEAISMAMGLHPTEVHESWKEDTRMVLDELEHNLSDYVAVGEVGIDLYWDKTYEREQMLALEMQTDAALRHNLPLIIHCREGQSQVLDVLKHFQGVKAVFHSFGGTPRDVEEIRKVGDFYFGINGIVTFKNCKVRESLPEITPTRLLLETDSPYLAPVPHRGKRNESAFIIHTAAHIAAHLDIPLAELEDVTTENAKKLFGI